MSWQKTLVLLQKFPEIIQTEVFYILVPFYRQENHNETAVPLNCSSGAQVRHGEYKTHKNLFEESMNAPICEYQGAGRVKIQGVCEKAGVACCVFFQTFAEKAEKT